MCMYIAFSSHSLSWLFYWPLTAVVPGIYFISPKGRASLAKSKLKLVVNNAYNEAHNEPVYTYNWFKVGPITAAIVFLLLATPALIFTEPYLGLLAFFVLLFLIVTLPICALGLSSFDADFRRNMYRDGFSASVCELIPENLGWSDAARHYGLSEKHIKALNKYELKLTQKGWKVYSKDNPLLTPV